MKEEIGLRIRSHRASQGFKQEAIAEQLGITAGAYAKIERGETDPSITRLYQIADVLNVSIYDFLEDGIAGKRAKTESMLENQITRLLTEMEILKKELKKIPKSKK